MNIKLLKRRAEMLDAVSTGLHPSAVVGQLAGKYGVSERCLWSDWERRHWKATMEYHRTKNIKYVQQLLGQKKLENTDFYTQLLNFENDEWHVAHARNLEEENKLIEAGFEYVRYSEKDEVAIYRKRK